MNDLRQAFADHASAVQRFNDAEAGFIDVAIAEIAAAEARIRALVREDAERLAARQLEGGFRIERPARGIRPIILR